MEDALLSALNNIQKRLDFLNKEMERATIHNSDKTICVEALKAIQKEVMFQVGKDPDVISDTKCLTRIELLCNQALQHIV